MEDLVEQKGASLNVSSYAGINGKRQKIPIRNRH
jgi:hypothetical protein